MPPQRVFALPRQQSLLLPAVINPFVQDTTLTKATLIKVSMVFNFGDEGIFLRNGQHSAHFVSDV